MDIPTEPIGSIPRPIELIHAVQAHAAGRLAPEQLEAEYDRAVRDTIEHFEATGSPVITDGEQRKPSFATYPVEGLDNTAPDGLEIPFEDGHVRRLPRITHGPFRYATYAVRYLEAARRYAHKPIKQAVISPSALSLLYPREGLRDYPRERFLDDLVREAETDVRRCLEAGAHKVQIDFTEGRLSLKIDPSGELLRELVALDNRVLERFSPQEQARIGVHTCPGGDLNSTHSADVDYAALLPTLFEMKAGNFYMQLASERNRPRVLAIIARFAQPGRRMFVGVVDPIAPAAEDVDTVRQRILEAASYIPVEHLGTTDDCGFSPFGDDRSTSRERAFAQIQARVDGTRLASNELAA